MLSTSREGLQVAEFPGSFSDPLRLGKFVGDLPAALVLPRRVDPRLRLPPGSVAIATTMTIIYPVESPGGWHLIGRTPLWMFDQRREQPVFLAPGDSLSFQRIDRKSFDRIARAVEAGTFDWATLVRDA